MTIPTQNISEVITVKHNIRVAGIIVVDNFRYLLPMLLVLSLMAH